MNLTAYTLASSSKGNSVFVKYGEDMLLIDAGISCRKIENAFKTIGEDITKLGMILITHEHSDHISGLVTMSKKYNIPIHMTENSAREMMKSVKYHSIADLITVHPTNFELRMRNIAISSFKTPHDSACSVGYKLTAGHDSFALATDLGHISREVETALNGVKNIVLESNHDKNMLLCGSYPYELKRRILSDNGHLSNEIAADFAKKLAENGTKRIILAHLSPENNIPELALATTQMYLRDTDCSVTVAQKDIPTFICGDIHSKELSPSYEVIPC